MKTRIDGADDDDDANVADDYVSSMMIHHACAMSVVLKRFCVYVQSANILLHKWFY